MGDRASAGESTGRIGRTVPPYLRAGLWSANVTAADLPELAIQATLDKAHVCVLLDAGLMPRAAAQVLLREIVRLERVRFAPLLRLAAPRGLYLAYEGYLRSRASDEIAGHLHRSRSRNDLNATIHRLVVRRELFRILVASGRFLERLLARASTESIPIPIYTHLQRAHLGTFQHYLLGIAAAGARCEERLLSLFAAIEECPLGAGAGGGSSDVFDTAKLAALLGFRRPCPNSLDAVASRDFVGWLLAEAAQLATLLSRMAFDLQLWCSDEFAVIRLPDHLSGSSSALPQKRNPFLLEHIQGRAAHVAQAFGEQQAASIGRPFSNSIATSTEPFRRVAATAADLRFILAILARTTTDLTVDAARGRSLARTVGAIAPAILELVVQRSGLPFRQLHREMGEALSAGSAEPADLERRLRDWFRLRLPDQPPELDPEVLVQMRNTGGGPGRESCQHQLSRLRALRAAHRERLRSLHRDFGDAGTMLGEAVASVLKEGPREDAR